MMTHVKKLCTLEGVSGREDAVRQYILKALDNSPAAPVVHVDPLGNILVQMKGKKRAAKKVLFAAHMDEVGLIVTGITKEGYLRFSTVGGIDTRVLFGKRVKINGRTGIIGGKAIHLCSNDEKKTAVDIEKLLIDIGAQSEEEAEKIAHPGDVAVFDSEFLKLEGGLVKARALDDRAGCALLLELASHVPEIDILLAFTVQEEIGLRGARTAAFQLRPDIAVILDATTAADTAGVPEAKQVCRVGGGPVVSFMDKQTLYDEALYRKILSLAEEHHIPAQSKTMVAGGNDAGAIQRAAGGARVAAVSLPCRYIHSPACVLAKRDMEAALALIRLLAQQLPV